jgi:hypothetical protein
VLLGDWHLNETHLYLSSLHKMLKSRERGLPWLAAVHLVVDHG